MMPLHRIDHAAGQHSLPKLSAPRHGSTLPGICHHASADEFITQQYRRRNQKSSWREISIRVSDYKSISELNTAVMKLCKRDRDGASLLLVDCSILLSSWGLLVIFNLMNIPISRFSGGYRATGCIQIPWKECLRD
jgi:hypothetical protein